MAADVKAVFRKIGAAIEKKDAKSLAQILEAEPGILQKGKAVLSPPSASPLKSRFREVMTLPCNLAPSQSQAA